MKNHNPNKKVSSKHSLSPLAVALISSSMMGVSLQASAGAWVPEKEKGYLKLGFASYKAKDYHGNNPSFIDFESTSISVYAEYGLGNNFAIYGSLLNQSYDQRDRIIGESNASGFGDSEIGLRYQWQANPFVVSTSFLWKTPALYNEGDGLGNSQNDYEARVLVGKSLNEYGYLGVELGYRLRESDPSDEYRYLLEYGFNVDKNLYFRTKLDGIRSANNADADVTNNRNLSNPLEFDSGKLELTAGWNFDKSSDLKGYGVEFTYTREVYGDNILEGNRYELGLTKVF